MSGFSSDEEDYDETVPPRVEGKSYRELSKTPPQLRRLVRRLRTPRLLDNFIPLLYEAISVVYQYAGSSPLWLKRELVVAILNEIDELDAVHEILQSSVAHFINLIDSGKLNKIKTKSFRCC